MRVRLHRFPVSNCCNKEKLESNHHVNKQKLSVTSSVNQMVIRNKTLKKKKKKKKKKEKSTGAKPRDVFRKIT